MKPRRAAAVGVRNPRKKRGALRTGGWDDDPFTRRAQRENFPARSVYKLQEIQKRFSILRKGDRVLDLGCAPGSWLLYAAEVAGSAGRVVGLDLSPVTIALPAHVTVLTGDVFELAQRPADFCEEAFDVVLSDMAPATTGSRGVDAARSFNLCTAALAVARRLLVPGGAFVCKIFQGEDFKRFIDAVRADFAEQRVFKPQSSRKASSEIYLVGKGKK
ncbi:MAG: RlmE family RNA methyltransferase [Desulfobacterales bacterium]|jgi:23S rRNA (uridine2552-2'-O)-methyltransferase|nr:RlmE family RNA methyltransferase [Desulfobacterales bacterium]